MTATRSSRTSRSSTATTSQTPLHPPFVRQRSRRLILLQANGSYARRILDFCSGAAFGARGSIERIAPQRYLITPEGLNVSTTQRTTLAD